VVFAISLKLYMVRMFAGVLFPCYCFSAIFKLWRAANYRKKMIGLIFNLLLFYLELALYQVIICTSSCFP